ncbi:hypothetical protein [Streptococcus suis]|uniref:hypothetical protein n=1 Tax=Streptococcus suis TaxID=1307 RepID=UPI0037D2A602
MYTLFTHKGLRERAPFRLTTTLKDYICNTRPEIIIVSPGYLSNRITTTQQFLDDLLSGWCKQSQYKIMGITAGMNGVDKNGNDRNLANHRSELGNKQINIINFKKNHSCATNRDHKKMVFLGKVIDSECMFPDEIDVNISTLRYFIGKIKITGVATGSSNFSKTAYLGSNNVADKGESDIFMYTACDTGFHRYLIESLERTEVEAAVPPILSESILSGNLPPNASKIVNNSLTDDEKYLTWMLYETLLDQLR